MTTRESNWKLLTEFTKKVILIADENMDLDEGTTSPFNEDGGEYVESQVSTKSEIQNKSSASLVFIEDDSEEENYSKVVV